MNVIIMVLLTIISAVSGLKTNYSFILPPIIMVIELSMVMYSVFAIRATIKKMKKAFPYERMTLVYFINLVSQFILCMVYYIFYFMTEAASDQTETLRYQRLNFFADVTYNL